MKLTHNFDFIIVSTAMGATGEANRVVNIAGKLLFPNVGMYVNDNSIPAKS